MRNHKSSTPPAAGKAYGVAVLVLSASDNDEYDLTLDYRFSAERWPQWLRPLWIRARAVRVEEKLGGLTDVTEDYRVIVNYEWVFK